MRAAATLVVALAACGRVGFDTVAEDAVLADAAPDTAMPDAADGDPSLALLMDFEGETTFLSASKYPTVCSGICPQPVAGRAGQQGASFEGNECVLIGANELRPGQLTFAAWARAVSTEAVTVFSRPFEGATTFTNTMEIFVATGTEWNVVVSTQASSATAPLNEWHHIAATYDGDIMTMYLNGVRQSSRSVGAIAYTDEVLRVGCDLNSGNEEDYFEGQIDDVRVYTRVLAPDEIALLAN